MAYRVTPPKVEPPKVDPITGKIIVPGKIVPSKIVVDEFGAGAIGQGMVNIVNKGSVDLDGQEAIGMFAKNNKLGTTFTNAIALMIQQE